MQAYNATHYTDAGKVHHTHYPAAIGADAAVQKEKVFGSYKRGTEPSPALGEKQYRLRMEQLDEDDKPTTTLEFVGKVGEDAVHKNSGTLRIQKLLGAIGDEDENWRDRVRRGFSQATSFLSKEGDRIMLWPDLMGSEPNKRTVKENKLARSGTLRVTLLIDTGEPELQRVFVLRGAFNFAARGPKFFQTLKRPFVKRFQQRLKAKFGRVDDSIKTMMVWRMEAGGNRCVFVTQQVGERFYVRDVEVTFSPNQIYVPGETFTPKNEMEEDALEWMKNPPSFGPETTRLLSDDGVVQTVEVVQSNVSSLEHMTALVMAAEAQPERMRGLEELHAALRQHAQELNRNPRAEASDMVHTAAYSISAALTSE